jgi:uncharacterized protein YndB with AHSA1/START domain
VFEAWTKPELLKRWWAPKSFGVSFLSCEADVRAGGTYRFAFGHAASEQPMEFFGRYIEVTPHSRLVWTNDEGGEGGAVTTVPSKKEAARHWSLCTTSIPRRKLSTVLSPPGVRVGLARRSSNWTSFSSPWAEAWGGHEVDLTAGQLGEFVAHVAESIVRWITAALEPRRPPHCWSASVCPPDSPPNLLIETLRC